MVLVAKHLEVLVMVMDVVWLDPASHLVAQLHETSHKMRMVSTEPRHQELLQCRFQI
jgi:hypothetical protein